MPARNSDSEEQYMIQKPRRPRGQDQPAIRPGEGAPARKLAPKHDPKRDRGKTEPQEAHRKIGNPAQRQLPATAPPPHIRTVRKSRTYTCPRGDGAPSSRSVVSVRWPCMAEPVSRAASCAQWATMRFLSSGAFADRARGAWHSVMGENAAQGHLPCRPRSVDER